MMHKDKNIRIIKPNEDIVTFLLEFKKNKNEDIDFLKVSAKTKRDLQTEVLVIKDSLEFISGLQDLIENQIVNTLERNGIVTGLVFGVKNAHKSKKNDKNRLEVVGEDIAEDGNKE